MTATLTAPPAPALSPARQKAAADRLAIVDCDIHPAQSTPTELLPFLPERWRSHLQRYGARVPQPFLGAMPYPRMTPGNGMRMDSWPEAGPPASDLASKMA